MTNTITVSRELLDQAHKLIHIEASRHTVDTEWTRCDKALRAALEPPQQVGAPFVATVVYDDKTDVIKGHFPVEQQERTCGTCKHHAKVPHEQPCYGCVPTNKHWEPKQ